MIKIVNTVIILPYTYSSINKITPKFRIELKFIPSQDLS